MLRRWKGLQNDTLSIVRLCTELVKLWDVKRDLTLTVCVYGFYWHIDMFCVNIIKSIRQDNLITDKKPSLVW